MSSMTFGRFCGTRSSQRGRVSAVAPAIRSDVHTRLRCTRLVVCRSSERDAVFDDKTYYRASIEEVNFQSSLGPAIILRIEDCDGVVLPIYVGDSESTSLAQEIRRQQTPTRKSNRPATHDLLKNTCAVLGYKVVLARINALVANTYYARLHLQREDGTGDVLDIDARPSDAINMAARFNAPLFVAKEVADEMGSPRSSEKEKAVLIPGVKETQAQIERSCQQEVALYKDPSVMKRLQLQLAIKEERFEDATQLRDELEDMMQKDLSMKLVIAIETALADNRYEEAARLRDELRARRSFNVSTQASRRTKTEPGHR